MGFLRIMALVKEFRASNPAPIELLRSGSQDERIAAEVELSESGRRAQRLASPFFS
jgi:hypothetical protein